MVSKERIACIASSQNLCAPASLPRCARPQRPHHQSARPPTSQRHGHRRRENPTARSGPAACQTLAIALLRPCNQIRHSSQTWPRPVRPPAGHAPVHHENGRTSHAPRHGEIAELLSRCNPDDPRPFVQQLSPHEAKLNPRYGDNLNEALRRLRRRVGITRKLTPHDLRRATAVKLYELTGDIRDVQGLLAHTSLGSTIWYLDHDLRPVPRQTLELLKGNRRKEKLA
jgi:hypothetical protein